ncbi:MULTISPECIES: hypothetical protein [unclassified Novosphingobium]|uniref:hypothetical protein n=1 Tax=unclassified Novosphingobium TaxID=2644732 RepID=UPI00146D3DFF|nr:MULTISPECIES: hypothetical protein [unclassified Novosphingobium]NMN04962.1 hypothetical protein [Novosphingobium sp. SG919]NMN87255.1 hypothetical protein [Novosphingobium sp. SG916]
MLHIRAPDKDGACPGIPLGARSLAIGYEQGEHPGQGIRLEVTGVVRSDDYGQPAKVVACFLARVPLDRLINTGVEDTPISHFLLVDGQGRIVAQVGDPPLTVDAIADLNDTGAMGRNIARELGSGLGLKDGEGGPANPPKPSIGTAQDVVSLSAGGEDYLAYIKPFLVPNAVSQPCSGAVGTPMAASGNAGGTTACYIVALMPKSAMTARWLETMPVERVGATLGLLFLAALLPFLRFQLMGAAQSSGPFEVIAMLAGVPAALVLALFMVLLAHDTDAGRRSIAQAAGDVAQRLALDTGGQVARQAGRLAALLETADAAQCSGFSDVTLLHEDGEAPSDVPANDGARAPAGAEKTRICTANPRRPVAIDISGRDYFQRLRDQNGTATPGHAATYLASGVRSQVMGVDTAVIAARLAGPGGQADRYAVGSFQLAALMQPGARAGLRADQRFMVVETRNWNGNDLRLPVIFHAQRGHAGQENLADQAETDPTIPTQIVSLAQNSAPGGGAPVLHFKARYAGRLASFAAVAVPGTTWVVLVWSNVAEIDAVAARTASLGLWSSLALLVVMLVVAGGLVMALRMKSPLPGGCPPARWANIWPHEAGAQAYAWLAKRILPLAGGILMVSVLLALALDGMAPGLSFCALAVPFTAVAVGVGLSMQRDTDDALTQKAEQPFFRLVVGTIALVALVPAVLVWLDARAFSVAHHAADRHVADLAANADRDRRAQLMAMAQCQGFGVDGLSLATQQRERNACTTAVAVAPAAAIDQAAPPQAVHAPFSAWPASALAASIWGMRQDYWFGAPAGVAPAGASASASYDVEWRLPLLDWLSLAVFGVVPVIALWLGLPRLLLRALCGFGVPLGLPVSLQSDVPGVPRLLVVGGDHASRSTLMADLAGTDPQNSARIDLSDVLLYEDAPALADSKICQRADDKIGDARIVQVYGLSLLLRDPLRRRAALVFLECVDRAVASGRVERLVVYSDLTPLERILDVVDGESFGQGERSGGLEELRWARFFQTFVTYTPADGALLIDPLAVEHMADLSLSAKALLRELRHLPSHIVATLLPGVLAHADRAERTAALADWARSRHLPTVPAAIDFLRVHLIEYYEQLWFASTQAERVVLDAIARGHFVNIHASLVVRSLVRRRLVTLEPGPRLFNDSFAMFVRQAERPETIRSWRNKLPKGEWNLARWPLLVGVPLGLLLVAYGAAQQGDNLNATISALLAGIPMLIGAFSRRQAAG